METLCLKSISDAGLSSVRLVTAATTEKGELETFWKRDRRHLRGLLCFPQTYISSQQSEPRQDIPGGPAVKNLPCNIGDMGSTCGQESDPTCSGVPHTTTRESVCHS